MSHDIRNIASDFYSNKFVVAKEIVKNLGKI